MIQEAVDLARQIEDLQQRTQVMAGILTFTDKIIDGEYRERLKEEWTMTQIGKQSICQAAAGFAPEYDCEQVYKAWSSSAGI